MHIEGTVTELVSQRPAIGYTVLIVGYTHRKVRIHIDIGKPPWRWVTLTNSTDVISLKTNTEGRFSADPKTPAPPSSIGQEGEKPPYHSASVTVKSASGEILAHQEESSADTAFSFALSVPFHLKPGHLAIRGHVTEKWTGHAAANYSVRVVGFSKRKFIRPPEKVGEKPETTTNKGETSPITITTDANGHFFTDPPLPPVPAPEPPGWRPDGPVTYGGASVTVSPNNIDLEVATKNVATPIVDFTMEVPGWISEGPRNFTGVIMSLAVHPTNPNVVYAGAQYGGVWKTTDGGATWKPTMDSESNLYVGAVGLCLAKPDVVYAAMASSADFWSSPGLFRSSDGGATWQRGADLSSASPAGTTRNLQIAVHPMNPDIVYVAADRALHRSDDGGATWLVQPMSIDGGPPTANQYGIFDGDISDVKLDPDHPDTVYIAAKGRGIFSSTDGGHNWSTLGVDVRFPVKYRVAGKDETKTIGFDNPDRSVLGLGGPASRRRLVVKVHGTILVSDDGGQNWRCLSGTSHGYEPDSPDWDTCIAVMPSNPDVIVAGGNDLFVTHDGGQSWRDIDGLHEDQQAIAFSGDNFYFANDGCIGRATTHPVPITTRKVSDGLVATQCRPRHLAVSQTALLVVGCSTYHTGILRSGRYPFEQALEIWEKINDPEGGLFEIDPTDEKKIFCAPWGQNELLVSADGGSHWNNRKLIFRDATDEKIAYPKAVGIRPDDNRRLYAGAFFGRLYYSVDGGDHWDHVKDAKGNPLLVTGGTGRGDSAISFDFAPANGAVLYVGTTDGRLWRTVSGATTSDGWEDLGWPSAGTRDELGAIAVDPNDSNVVFVGYSTIGTNRVWRGTQQMNGSFAWANASVGLPKSSVEALIIDPHHPGHVFAATNRGVYGTADAGATWHALVGGLPNVRAIGLQLRSYDRTLWVSTYCRGIFSLQLP